MPFKPHEKMTPERIKSRMLRKKPSSKNISITISGAEFDALEIRRIVQQVSIGSFIYGGGGEAGGVVGQIKIEEFCDADFY